MDHTLDQFVDKRAVLLTSYRRAGTPVATTVNMVVEGDHGFVRTWSTSGKAKRIRHNPVVEVEPSTMSGKPTGGPRIRARARQLHGDEERHARRLIKRKHPLLHGAVVPTIHKVTRRHPVFYELRPADQGENG
jgi:PPOX class probable F420-dependent enzyme